jgi:alkanesulfonate monooxygenase SsuD/methylene tetrahydromethanopterin reductase-like flavin-dependent oxidoreductase (luciferase family)
VKRAIDVAPFGELSDPRVLAELAAVACATTRVRIGPLVTPVSRRRVQKLARETVTLDRLSSGRLTFGVGLGSARNNELEPFGEVVDPRERARLLDAGLDELARYWDGLFPIGLPGPDADPGPWERAGATWTVTDFGMQPTRAQVSAVIEEGPR